MTVRKIEPLKNGCKYIFDVYYYKDGEKKRYRSKAFRTIAETKDAEREFLNHQESPYHTIREIVGLYISSHKNQWKLSTLETNTRRMSHICDYMGDKTLSDLTQGDLTGFCNYLDKLCNPHKKPRRVPYSARYKNQVITYFKAVCKYAETYLGESSRVASMLQPYRLESKPTMQFLTDDQFEEFIQYVDSPPHRALLTFLFNVGCRRGEALRLRFDDVDFNTRTISITKAWNKLDLKDISPKTKSSVRTIPINKKAFECVLKMKDLYHTGRVFGGKKPLSPVSIDRARDSALAHCNIPHFRIHDLRHSFISNALMKGMPVTMVRKYVGHSSIKTTLDTYAHFTDKSLRNFIDSL